MGVDTGDHAAVRVDDTHGIAVLVGDREEQAAAGDIVDMVQILQSMNILDHGIHQLSGLHRSQGMVINHESIVLFLLRHFIPGLSMIVF